MDPTPKTLDYATRGEPRPRLTRGDYLFHLFVSALLLAVLSAPMWSLARIKRVYESFGMKVPAATQLVFDLHDALGSVRAPYWVWAVPFLVPLAVGRASPAARRRWWLVVLLLAAVAGVAVVVLVQEPLWQLIEGLIGSPGKP